MNIDTKKVLNVLKVVGLAITIVSASLEIKQQMANTDDTTKVITDVVVDDILEGNEEGA